MSDPTFVAVPLAEKHRTNYLNCGEESLDRWLHKQALKDQNLARSRTFVWADDEDIVCGYYTLLQTTVEEDEDGVTFFRKLRPKNYPDMSAPAVLLGKLAISEHLQGKGMGLELLGDAYYNAYEAVCLVGGVFFVVDPSDRPGVREFYERGGFESLAGVERMFLIFQDFNGGSSFA